MELRQVRMEKSLNLSVVCRTCLGVTPSTISINSKDLKYNVPLTTMINSISSFELQEDVVFPDKLCYNCAEQLRIAYGFQQMCDDSFRTLLTHSNVAVKAKDTKKAMNGCQETKTVPVKPEVKNVKNEQSDEFYEVEYLEEYLVEEDESAVLAKAESTETTPSAGVDMETTSSEDEMAPHTTATAIRNQTEADSCTADETEPEATTSGNGSQEIDNQCNICGRVLSKQSHLLRHLKTHAGARPFRCRQCPLSFTRSDNLRQHEKTHVPVKNYKCPQCDKYFRRIDAVKLHMGSQHRAFVKANYYPCTICDNFFKTKMKLNVHLESHKVDKIKIVCEICGKAFVEMLAYETHRRKHEIAEEEPTPHQCTHCEKTFPNKGYLDMHLRYHTGDKPYKCKYCCKSFQRSTEWKIHESYHTGHKPYACKVCGKSFHRDSTLQTHMKIHTDNKSYQCSYCGKGFHQKYDMITHERRHTGERFSCKFCEEKFIHLHQLNSHLKIVHECDVDCRKRGVKTVLEDAGTRSKPDEDVS